MEPQKRMTLDDNIVICVGFDILFDDNEDWDNMDKGTLTQTKMILDEMRKRKSNMADEINAINVRGNIEPSTRFEIIN